MTLDEVGDDERARLVRALLGSVRRGPGASLPEDEFNSLALRAHRYQLARNPVLAAFARRRGADAESLDDWTRIALVPTAAFKTLRLITPPHGCPEIEFRTSGTSRGRSARGRHPVLDLTLYRESLWANAAAHLLGDRWPALVVSLIPPVSDAPDSSLSFMIDEVTRRIGCERLDLFDVRRGLRADEVDVALDRAEAERAPVLVVATAFALALLLDELESRSRSFRLPSGSALMETGGFKGRVRAVPRAELYRRSTDALGLQEPYLINEYGMTELLSQCYDGVAGRAARVGTRVHRAPPWMKARVLDPATLEEVETGEVGILGFVDLANLDSAIGILTEDRARRVGDGFQPLGRATGAEARGCSLVAEQFMESLGETR